MVDRYGQDVLANDPHRRSAAQPTAREVEARAGLVVECRSSGFCGAVIRTDRDIQGHIVELEDRHGRTRAFPLRPAAFLLDGETITLIRPARPSVASPAGPARSASGSTYVHGARARVARASRIWVEGLHDAELVEKVWGHDLRVEGVVVEPLHGADHLVAQLREFDPGPDQRVGVLLDHLVKGSKESVLAERAMQEFGHVLVVGHPYVDVWQAVRPQALGIQKWPAIPRGTSWKGGIIAQLGLPADEREAWDLILTKVRSYADLEPTMLGRVEELIDFVTS